MSRPMVDHVAQRERRLDDLIARLGVDRSRFTRADHGAVYEKASWNCVRCTTPNACLDWLDKLAIGVLPPPHVCPNCELIRAFVDMPFGEAQPAGR